MRYLWLLGLGYSFVLGGSPSLAAEPVPSQKLSAPLVLPPLPEVFKSILDDKMPLTTDEIRQLKMRLDKTKQAASEWPGVPPKPRVTQVTVDMSPGGSPPVLRVAPGHGAAISFLDNTGAPWPVIAFENAAKEDFLVSQTVPKSAGLAVTALGSYGNGNLLVYLQDLPTPVAITILSGQKSVDYRFDVRLSLSGPLAIASPVPMNPSPQFDSRLTDVLDGLPPLGVKSVLVNGVTGMAWKEGGKLMLRTRLMVLSPAPSQESRSADGMRAYLLDYTPQVLASDDGKMVTLKISD